MANEIMVSALLRYSKTRSLSMFTGEKKFTMSGDQHSDTVMQVKVTEKALELGSVPSSNLGWVLIQNEDDTNYVSLRRASGEENFMKIKASEFALFRLEATAPYIIAEDGATCNVRITLLED